MAIGTDVPTQAEQTAQAEQAFRLERRGIDHIPERDRWARPRDVGAMWAGASLQIEYFVYGAILMTFGFTFVQAVSLIVIGNLSYVVLGLCSLQGPDAGTTVFAINRASYGPHGSRLISLFNWLTQIGFEAEGLILIVGAGLVLTTKAGFTPGTPAKIVLILVAVAVQVIVPFLGHATILKTLRVLIVPFVVLYAVLLGLTVGHVSTTGVAHGAGWQLYMVGLAFTIALAGLGWAESGNDYSRYVSRRASKKALVGWVFVGTAIPEILVMTLGAAVATFVDPAGAYWGSANPLAGLAHQTAIPAAFVVAFLVFAILQLLAVNSLDLYSSGVTLQALGVPVRRYRAVLIDSAICLCITLYAIFDSTFSTLLKDFVAVVIAWIGPWLAVYLVDWGLRGWRYVPAELQRTDRGSLYWRTGGIHWPALVAQAVGSTLAVLAISQPFFVGPIASAFGGGGADLSVFTGIAGGGLTYLLLAWRGVRAEAVVQRDLLAAEPA